MVFKRATTFIFIAALTVMLSSCSQLAKLQEKEESSNNVTGYSANKLFQDARASLNAGNFETAIKQYETLEARCLTGLE